jgi:CPA2 family monovalent cation:H+ antiporter-2
MDLNPADLTAIALVTTVAVLFGLLLTGLRQPPIVGYILAGVVLGPTGLGVIKSSANVTALAELGVLMLLFLAGMELSLRAFVNVLRVAVLCVALQLIFSLAVAAGLGAALGWSYGQGLLLAFIVSLSSTAVALKMLHDVGELGTDTGRLTVGVLVAQDLAVVPMLILVGSLGGGELDWRIAVKLAAAAVLLGVVTAYLSRHERLVLPATRWLARKADLVPLAALALCFSAATISGVLGLSPAYGAFFAGLVIANSTARVPAIRAIRPIQNVLLVTFFLAIGLLIDLQYIWSHLGTVALLLLTVTLLKTVINIASLRLLGAPIRQAFLAGAVMGQIGEFSFVLAATGFTVGAIDGEGYRLAIAVIALSLMFSPVWLAVARRIGRVASDRLLTVGLVVDEAWRPERTAAGRAMDLVRHVLAERRNTRPQAR